MIAKLGLLFGILWISGVKCDPDYRNQVIKCVFKEYTVCYRDISSLGANFSAIYDETNEQMDSTCQSEPKVEQCVSDLVTACNSVSSKNVSENITSFIHELCSNTSAEHKSFLNSSKCYNRFRDKRLSCVKEFSSGNKTDAKSLCCSNLNTKDCLMKEMEKVCPKETEFQDRLMTTYISHQSVLCAPYFDLCNSGDTLMSVFAVLSASLVSLLLQKL